VLVGKRDSERANEVCAPSTRAGEPVLDPDDRNCANSSVSRGGSMTLALTWLSLVSRLREVWARSLTERTATSMATSALRSGAKLLHNARSCERAAHPCRLLNCRADATRSRSQ
jgi:hypothetical protein